MNLPSFKTINTPDQNLNLIQSNVASALNSLNGPFIGGVLLTSISVNSSPTVINHTLGRQPQIWVLCDQNTNTNVWRTAWSSNSITLRAGSACTVSLWIN